MKYLCSALLIGVLVFGTTKVEAKPGLTVGLLAEFCSSENAESQARSYCIAYLRAWADAIYFLNSQDVGKFACMPETLMPEILRVFLLNWVLENPETANVPVRSGMVVFLNSHYPCSR